MIRDIIDIQTDSVRFYYLNKNIARRAEVLGVETSYNVNDAIII